MIGIKNNCDIKVWVNENYGENLYRPARDQQVSVQALYRAVKGKVYSNNIYGNNNMSESNIYDDKRIMDRVDRIIYNPIPYINKNTNNNSTNTTKYGNKFDIIRNTLRQ